MSEERLNALALLNI
ncbi:hypothetical protein FWK35_00036094 [Aphis craccivora]|uniref:Uncharacterized protein n=1 Tax=Aphis craccivora TaxID=307492 RepID=A0A6G0VSQ5_APHCR|nr:hypothetical protein FWK35_00036094 [Aphis craccivora]